MFFKRVYDTHMANQRKQGVERVTLTIPKELLSQAEAEADRRGVDRLVVIREAIEKYLSKKKSQ